MLPAKIDPLPGLRKESSRRKFGDEARIFGRVGRDRLLEVLLKTTECPRSHGSVAGMIH